MSSKTAEGVGVAPPKCADVASPRRILTVRTEQGRYLQGLQALQKGSGFVFILLCWAAVRIRAGPGIRLSRWRGTLRFVTIVLFLHFL